jgi:hypothetical protein
MDRLHGPLSEGAIKIRLQPDNFNGDTWFPLRRSRHPAMNKMKREGNKNFARTDQEQATWTMLTVQPTALFPTRSKLETDTPIGFRPWFSRRYAVKQPPAAYKYSVGRQNLLHQGPMMQPVSETSGSSPNMTWLLARKDFTAHRCRGCFKSCKGLLHEH